MRVSVFRTHNHLNGHAKISSMNKVNCVSDLMSDLKASPGCAALSIYILLLQPPLILTLVIQD